MAAHKPLDFTVTRQELYNRVWSDFMSKVALAYGISGPALKKICDKHEIPTPPVGYWTRLQWDKPVEQTPLPDASTPALQVVHIKVEPKRPKEGWAAPQAARRYPVNDPDLFPLIDFERDPKNKIVVPDHLHNPHPRIRQAMDALAARRSSHHDEDDRGKPPIADELPEVDMRVEKSMRPRAFRLLNALFRALEKRGHRIEVKPRPGGEADGRRVVRFLVLGEDISFRLLQKSRRIYLTKEEQRQTPNYEFNKRWGCQTKIRYEPTETLELTLSWLAFRDTAERKLENQLNEVVIGMLRLVDQWRTVQKKRDADRLAQIAAAEEQERRARLEEIEQNRLNCINSLADDWENAHRLRKFAESVREEAIRRHGSIDGCEDVRRWLRWVEAYARTIDPLGANHPLPSIDDLDG
jgi:hypothetical protein